MIEHKEEIEQIFGQELYWQELKGKKASRISISRDNFNLYEDNDWEKDFAWFENNAIRLKKAICPFLKII